MMTDKPRLTALILALVAFVTIQGHATGPLAGKSVALLGDSMTWIGGDSCNIERGWSSHFRNLAAPASIAVYARSGATWTNAPDTKVDPDAFSDIIHSDNVLYNQMVRLLSDVESGKAASPDLVVLYAGANDAWFGKYRPGIYTAGAMTADGKLPADLAGSVTEVCRGLQRALPASKLVLVAPAQIAQTPLATVTRVADTIATVGDKLGIPVIRTDVDGPITRGEELAEPRHYTSDGVHTNPAGAAALGRFIYVKLCNILK